MDDAIDSFDGSLGDPALEIANDALPVLSEGLSEFAERSQSTAHRPLTPALEKLGTFAAGSFIEIL